MYSQNKQYTAVDFLLKQNFITFKKKIVLEFVDMKLKLSRHQLHNMHIGIDAH